MDLAIEVLAAVIVIIAFAAERITEVIATPLLKKYGIEQKEVRTSILVLLVTAVNFALLYGFDIDLVARLLEQNSSIVTIALAAFSASGLSAQAHGLEKFLNKGKNIAEVLHTAGDIAENQ